MKDADKKDLLMIADTIETNGGWRIAAVKIRGFVEDYEKLESALREVINEDEWGGVVAYATILRIRDLLSSTAQKESQHGT